MLNDKMVWLVMWRLADGQVWKEAGVWNSREKAVEASNNLSAGSGLQSVILEWRNPEGLL